MQPSDFQLFRNLMVGMAKMFEREIDGPLLDAYWLALKGMSLEEFHAAAAHLMRTSEFMPRPAAFTEIRKAGELAAGEAWLRVMAHITSGAYREGLNGHGEHPMGDPMIDAVVRMVGGYRAIAYVDTGSLHFVERRFCEHYEALEDREEMREAVPCLAGPPQHGRLGGPVHVAKLLERQS